MKRVEEVEVERRGKKLEVLNFLEMWCFFSPLFYKDDMHDLAS